MWRAPCEYFFFRLSGVLISLFLYLAFLRLLNVLQSWGWVLSVQKNDCGIWHVCVQPNISRVLHIIVCQSSYSLEAAGLLSFKLDESCVK